jgi:FkbM family methyltransferase
MYRRQSILLPTNSVRRAVGAGPPGESQLKQMIKKAGRSAVRGLVRALNSNRAGRYVYTQVLTSAMERSQEVTHGGVPMRFAVPNMQNVWRIDTFSSKEPETLEWIDRIPKGSVVWDIGANVGLYAVYAAKARGCRVIAFEPSVFNLELLARNIVLNDLTRQIIIVPLPLSDERSSNTMNMTSTEWGAALSTFGKDYGHDGTALKKVFEYQVVGLSMSDAVEFLHLPQPDYIKLDVDGIEHLILSGGAAVLRAVKGVLIEINDNFREQAEGCSAQLTAAGLTMVDKRHSDMVENSDFRGAFNQIWARKS